MNQQIFNEIATIMEEVSGIETQAVTAESDIVKDLNVDSLDFLDTVFEIEEKYDIEVPLEEWRAEMQEDDATENIYQVSVLVGRIEKLIQAKQNPAVAQSDDLPLMVTA